MRTGVGGYRGGAFVNYKGQRTSRKISKKYCIYVCTVEGKRRGDVCHRPIPPLCKRNERKDKEEPLERDSHVFLVGVNISQRTVS